MIESKPNNLFVKPYITEKATKILEKENKYFFLVGLQANKIEIKNKIKKLYQVSIEDVNTIIYRCNYKNRYIKNKGHTKYKTHRYKLAIVKLKEGDSIDIYNNK